MKNAVPRFHRSIRDTENYKAYAEAPSMETWQALKKELQPTIDAGLKSFANGDKTYGVRAQILAKQAVDSYDPNNPDGASLTTHVYNHLKRLNRYREQRSSPVHYPESMRNDRRAIYKFTQDFEEKHQREPTHSEIMDSLALSKKRLTRALDMRQDVPSSQMESDKGHQIGETISPKEIRRRKRMDLVYVDMDNVGKKIMEWGMGYNGSRTLPKAAIASKLGISAPAVSQRISTILNKVEAPEIHDESERDMRPVDDAEGIDSDYIGRVGLTS